jgi:hypothetical protein
MAAAPSTADEALDVSAQLLGASTTDRLMHPPKRPCKRRADGSDQVLEAHDVFVSNAHEHILPVPEDRPAILLLDVGGVNLAFVLEFVTADVDAVRVQVGPSHLFGMVGLIGDLDAKQSFGAMASLASAPRRLVPFAVPYGWPRPELSENADQLRASARGPADIGLHRCTPLRSEGFGGGDQRQEHL